MFTIIKKILSITLVIIIVVILIGFEVIAAKKKDSYNITNQSVNQKMLNHVELLTEIKDISNYIGKKILVRGNCKIKTEFGDPVITNVHLFFEEVISTKNIKIFKFKDNKQLGYWCHSDKVKLYK